MAVPDLNAITTPEADNESWWQRNRGAVTATAALGAALAFRRPLGRIIENTPFGQVQRGIQGTFAPTSMPDKPIKLNAGMMAPILHAPGQTTAREGEAMLREYMGGAARSTDQAYNTLKEHWPKVGNLSPQEADDLVHYMETRGQGAKISNPELQPAANAMRNVYERYAGELGNLAKFEHRKGEFLADYYRHLYKPKEGGDLDRVGFAKLGNSSFMLGRKIPTIREAKALGYEPITNDPIEMTIRYATNASRFIAREKILENAQRQRLILPMKGTKRPPDGWVKLFERGMWHYYAPEGFARVFNNYASKGFTGPMGDLYQPLQQTFNAITATELGLSGYHAVTMANEAIVSEVARAAMEGASKDATGAIKALIGAPLAPVSLYRRGKAVEQSWLGTVPGTEHMRRITDLMERAGGRARSYNQAADYKYSGLGSYFESWKRGALKLQLEMDKSDLKNLPLGPLKVAFRTAGRLLDTVASPLFEYYIPRLKNGAFYETMSTWLTHNPTAGEAEQMAAARMIWDSIDNRFGELVQDNVFWDRTLKQAAMLTQRSYSWNTGTLREIGGGTKDILSGEFTPRAAYVIALPIVTAAISALYQGLKTGQPPADVQDLIAPRTGGVDPATGKPERLAPVGYMKDVLSWSSDPIRTATGKISSGPRLLGELATGKDWMGLPIRDPRAAWGGQEWLSEYTKHVVDTYKPITLKNYMQRKRDTKITPAETAMGLAPAGRNYVDPEGLASIKERISRREYQRKQRYEQRQRSYYEE